MLDHRVVVKAKAIIDQNLIGSCVAIMTNERGQPTFKEITESNGKYFEKGSICFLPIEMELKKHQFIGSQPPTNDDESDLEQSDDDSEDNGMNNRKFKVMIRE